MKLLDVLAKEMKEWPEGAACIMQDADGEIKAGDNGKPEYSSKLNIWIGCHRFEGLFIPETLSDDYSVSVVTKEQWERAKLKSKTTDSLQPKHKHAEMIALCAEFAQTMEDPMSMFQYWWEEDGWQDFEKDANIAFYNHREYRLKPKTHTVHGVEIPDLRFVPKVGEKYYAPDPLMDTHQCITSTFGTDKSHYHRVSNNLCYENTEEGKQAAILHAKAWLGIA